MKLSQNAKIIEVMGKSSINELEADGTKMIFKGNNDYQLIYFLDGEYSSLTFSAPIKYELDSRSTPSVPKTFSWHADSSISSVRARHDGERLFVDCELNFGINLRCEQEIGILDEMIFSEYLDKKRSEILLCYPEKNASIWSVAKQYGEPQRSIRQKNAIPENENSVKRRYLVI